MKTINVARTLKTKDCLTSDQGWELREKILSKLNAGRMANLDFSGCEKFTALFFNCAIAHLVKSISIKRLNRRITFTGLSVGMMQTLKTVVTNLITAMNLEELYKKDRPTVMNSRSPLYPPRRLNISLQPA